MYHVFEFDYDSSEFKGSSTTLKEAYDLVQGVAAELYENSVDDLMLKHVADFFEESQPIDGDYNRAHRKRGWLFIEDKRIEVIEEYSEHYEQNQALSEAEGHRIMGTGMIPVGRWVRDE